jgi:outer membrane protein assembly factor BamE (lipoprotein component of BamABCDE complex)
MNTNRLNLIVALALITAVGLGCMGMRKPWRDYSPRPFDSREWLEGDRIERGRMTLDIVKRRIPNGRSRDTVLETFGEPDNKNKVEGKEVWYYKTDVGVPGALDNFPISFDEKGRASVGVVRGDTISIGVTDEEV